MLFDFLQVANTIGQSLDESGGGSRIGLPDNSRPAIDDNLASLVSRVFDQQRRPEAPASSANMLNANQQQPPHYRSQAASDARHSSHRSQRLNQYLSNYLLHSQRDPSDKRQQAPQRPTGDALAAAALAAADSARMHKGPAHASADCHKPLDLSVKSGLHVVQSSSDRVERPYGLALGADPRTLIRLAEPPFVSLQTVLPSNGTQYRDGDVARAAGNLVTCNAARRRARARKQQVRSTPKALITSSTSPSSTASHPARTDQHPTAATANPFDARCNELPPEPISSTNGQSAAVTPFDVSGRRSRHRKKSIETSSSGSGSGSGSAENTSRAGARGHMCDQCGRSFSRSDMLTRHSRLHSGHKPYQCGRCSQVFSRSDHLSTHERTHTGEKPYQCEFCPYSACRRDMITRHMRTHSNLSNSAKPRDQRRRNKLTCSEDRSSPSDAGEPESSNIEAETSGLNDDAMTDPSRVNY